MSKYGWTKGSGLGASGSGIKKALQVKVEKQKKKPDSEGGGVLGPKGGLGKVIGPKGEKSEEEGKFGAMSEVVILHHMVDGIDLDEEMEGSQDGGIMQEIGEECNEKYGRVERVFIDRRSGGGSLPVFVKFSNELSALRVSCPVLSLLFMMKIYKYANTWQAVNALEGRMFNGNIITARFFETQRFDQGIYE